MKNKLFKAQSWYPAFCLGISLFISFSLKAENKGNAPDSTWLGNWIETTSQEWRYGFYEKFAVYDADFWEYQSVKSGKRQVVVTLTQDDRQVTLRLQKTKDGKVKIAEGKMKARFYELARPGFRPYPSVDTACFGKPRLHTDTVTLLGYYRNLEQLPVSARRKAVEIFRNDFIADKQMSYYAAIDSLGRFKLKMPAMALEEWAVDWGFLNKKIQVEPGEKVFLYADAAELFARNKGDREEYWTNERNLLFMGKNARLHTEYAYCPSPLHIRGYYDLEKLPDLQLLDSLMKDLSDFRQQFQAYREKYPTLSRKCILLVEMNALFETGRSLMQNRFGIRKKKRLAFAPGYMERVQQTFPLDCEWFYQASSSFRTFIRDYTEYWAEQKDKYLENGARIRLSPVNDDVLFRQLRMEDVPGGPISDSIERYQDYLRRAQDLFARRDTLAFLQYNKENGYLIDYIYERMSSEAVRDLRRCLETKYTLAAWDSLLPSPYLRELLLARKYAKEIEKRRGPLSERELALLQEEITIPAIRERVFADHEKYRKLARKEMTWLESLKENAPLKAYTDARKLFEQLIAPYKGNVIYLDIWGTWCAPCREQMKYAGALKEALKDEKVIFMYLANRSDEKSWKNIIREYDLTGKNVVHYRLPEDQQRQVEQLLKVNSYPTFMLLDKEGNIADPNTSMPEAKEKLVKKIRKLLKQ